ncbi:hypothetical protein ACHAXH_002639 [Discostella pseudostelligera]
MVILLLNSTISIPEAKFACFDITNFYLSTPLDYPEYVCIKITDIPQEFIDEYNLTEYEHNGWVYFEINNRVYGLKQVGLTKHGYYQCATTPGLWRHKLHSVTFVLIVDDFDIQYIQRCHAEHILEALQQDYLVTTDWTGTKFTGIDIKWDCTKCTCHLSMKRYINEMMIKYDHPCLHNPPQHSPHAHCKIIYGAKEQLVPDTDTSPPLNDAGIRCIQGIIGSLLFY